jgi:hypothetical protein
MQRTDATLVVTSMLAAALSLGTTLVSCGSDDGAPGDTVDGAAAVTALVNWAAEELPVVENESGEVELPVVYVTAQSGDTMDAGLQASVVADTTESATVRFADDRIEAIDDQTDNDAVRDGGVMLVVGELPEPAPTLTVDVEWYESLDSSSVLVVQIDAAESGAAVITAKSD